jgi:LemA protein
MSLFLIVFLGGILLIAFFAIGSYNSLVTMRQGVRESWSAIETELRRRYDLIPNIVETVKGYASHERETLEGVIKARSSVNINAPPDQQAQAQTALSGALGKLMALSEAYPDLKANQNFMQLQNELNETETRISQARRYYNANVKDLNTACEMFPSAIIAGMFNFKHEPYFGLDDPAAAEPVKISFSSAPAIDAGANLKISQQQPENRQ